MTWIAPETFGLPLVMENSGGDYWKRIDEMGRGHGQGPSHVSVGLSAMAWICEESEIRDAESLDIIREFLCKLSKYDPDHISEFITTARCTKVNGQPHLRKIQFQFSPLASELAPGIRLAIYKALSEVTQLDHKHGMAMRSNVHRDIQWYNNRRW